MSARKTIDRLGCVIGRGLLAGLAGTAAITISQALEMSLTGRGPSSTPAQAVEKVFGIKALDPQHEARLTHFVHWTYGTSWGLFRGLLDMVGLRGFQASLVHWLAISGSAMTILPGLHLTPPPHKWPVRMHVSEGVHHFLYAATVGCFYDLMAQRHWRGHSRCLTQN
jgi:hypothetical protein